MAKNNSPRAYGKIVEIIRAKAFLKRIFKTCILVLAIVIGLAKNAVTHPFAFFLATFILVSAQLYGLIRRNVLHLKDEDI